MIGLLEKTKLGQLLRKGKLLNEETLFVEVMTEKVVQNFIVKLNTDQMKLHFMNSEGKLLSEVGGSYSDFTMSKGKKKSPDSVDLYDTGEFHESFSIVRITGKQFEIDSDPIKGSTNLLVEWGKEIEGLTFENMRNAGEFMLVFYRKKILKYLLG